MDTYKKIDYAIWRESYHDDEFVKQYYHFDRLTLRELEPWKSVDDIPESDSEPELSG